MSDNSAIEWTDATWNPITGCSVVSPGCTNCYAMKLAGTRLRHHESRAGLTDESRAGPVWNGQVRFNEQWLNQPLRWRKPRRIFVCAHGDLFHEAVPDEWIDRVFAVMALAPQHQFQVLTKRAERMRKYLTKLIGDEDRSRDIIEASRKSGARLADLPDLRDRLVNIPLPNVWLGVSVEDQARADERIPHLLETPAAVRFVSAEPLLGPVDLTACPRDDALLGYAPDDDGDRHKVDWVIVGGESGTGARPMHPDWARSLRDQCVAAGVPYFFKQWGAWAPGENYPGIPTKSQHVAWWWNNVWAFDCLTPRASEEMLHRDDEPDLYLVGKKNAGRLLDGREWNQMPEAT